MCQVVGIQMDEFRMNELPPWAQNNLQRDTYVSINIDPLCSHLLGSPGLQMSTKYFLLQM